MLIKLSNMLFKLLCFTCLVTLGFGDELVGSSEVDPIVYYLLNGEYENKPAMSTDVEEPALDGGLWKCGQCEGIRESRLIYSEASPDADVNDASVDVKIEVTMPGMRCVIVRTTSSSIVKSVIGDCEGPSVTLVLAPAKAFMLDVYGDNEVEEKL